MLFLLVLRVVWGVKELLERGERFSREGWVCRALLLVRASLV